MRINEENPVASSTLSSESMTTSVRSSDDYSTMPPKSSLPLSTFFIENCVYRGEGNANVVIALPQVRYNYISSFLCFLDSRLPKLF